MAQVTEPEQLEASSMAQVTEAEQYQVFINHRGPDTKTNVASLIYEALVRYGLSVFLDKEELCKGDTLSPAIRGAISSSSVYIAIFSKNYAQSPWCLNELCWMLKLSHERCFIPIFYDVQPADLRYIDRGCYADAFHEHQQKERVSMEVVEGWKKALGEAADIIGLTFKPKESDYGKFVKEIEDIVIKQVKRDPLEVAAHPVGLDQVSKNLQDHIQNRIQDINGRSQIPIQDLQDLFQKVVVIAGLGGIGKSTLARHIFNDLSRPVFGQSEFSRASYLCNVRETVDLTSLQRRLYRDLLGKDRDIPNTNEGKTMLRKGLRGLKILIVFDDVDDWRTIESVLDINAMESDSRIFITSRDGDILRGSSVMYDSRISLRRHTRGFFRASRYEDIPRSSSVVYDVQPLEQNYARELFCYHAFHQVNPREGYADLVDKFLEFCEGLPLLLEVLGQQLAGRLDITYWEEHLASFLEGEMPPSFEDIVIKKLKWSTEALRYEQLKMFLDVAYFLVGEDEELAVRVLEGLGKYASDHLKNLGKKGLVSFKNDVECHDEIRNEGQDIAIPEGKHLILPAVLPKRRTKIIMHNQLRALARYIISKEPPSRYHLCLSCSNDIEKMLQSQSGTVFCRGICIRKDRSPPQVTNNINISDVRLLVVEHPKDSSWILPSRISGDLVWLRWRHSRLTSLPSTISVRNLRVLELETSKDDLEGFFASKEMPSELRELNIDLREEGASSSTSSSAQPVDLPLFTKTAFFYFLESIDSNKELRKIVLKNLTVPQSLPFDFSELKNLRHLDLSGSTNLTTLPNSISQLLQLQHLALRDCINLSIPTHILGQITTLEHIDFKGCAQLVQLPEGISSQRSLRYLNLLETRLTELAWNLEPLGKLEQLRIGSASLEELSGSNLVHLKELILVKCDTLKQIHTPYLERLEIYGSRVPHLPVGIALHKHLKVLTIYSSPIENFALDMYALTNLTLMHTSIHDISIPVGACPRLEIVDLSDNLQLHQVQVFQPTLVKLNLDGCLSLEYLRLAELVHLKCLNINGCGCVQTLDVENWGSLEEIRAETCWKLRMREEAWSQMGRLKFFSFSQKFRWDEVQEKVGNMEKDEYEMVQEEVGSMEKDEYEMVREKAGSMEKAKYEMMFQLFMSMTIRMLRPVKEHELEFELEKLNEELPYLMCFLTSDEGELTKCNDFMVRFVYTTIKSYETRANETRANETRWFAITSLHSCQEIMAYGTGTPKGVCLLENEESLERVGDDNSGEICHVQQPLEGDTMAVSILLEDEMSSHLKRHSKGVSHPFHQLLRKVARVILCCHGSRNWDD